jgi:hypothetical protein
MKLLPSFDWEEKVLNDDGWHNNWNVEKGEHKTDKGQN